MSNSITIFLVPTSLTFHSQIQKQTDVDKVMHAAHTRTQSPHTHTQTVTDRLTHSSHVIRHYGVKMTVALQF